MPALVSQNAMIGSRARSGIMRLNSLQEIERAIDALLPEQREQLSQWLEERYPLPADVQLKTGIEAGCFDERIARAVADDKAGKTQPL